MVLLAYRGKVECMTTRKTTSIVIKTDQSEESGKWSWVCVMDDELAGMGVGETSREDAQQIALKLVSDLIAEGS